MLYTGEYSDEFQKNAGEVISQSRLLYTSDPWFDRKFNGNVITIWSDPFHMLLMGQLPEYVRSRYYDL
jgi:hypothetical protein